MSERSQKRLRMRQRLQSGFTLIETMIAALVLTVGVLGLAAMLADGLAYMSMSQMDYIAQEKASEAVESIFTARDIGQSTWDTICNVGSSVCTNGIYVNGPQPLCDPGLDGIVGTADDFNGTACKGPADAILLPSAGGVLNTTTATRASLSDFRRSITISPSPTGIANLRQIQVTIAYRAGKFLRNYTMTTDISNF